MPEFENDAEFEPAKKKPGWDGKETTGSKRGQKPPLHLSEMREVYRTDKCDDTTPGHRYWRKILEKDPERFGVLLQKFEMEQRQFILKAEVELGPKKGSKAAPGAPDSQESDVGESRARSLAERFLESVRRRFG